MRSHTTFVVGSALVQLFAVVSQAEIQSVAERNENEIATRDFRFKHVPSPSRNDAATTAKFTVLDGRRDVNGGDVQTLRDGRVPRGEDSPSENFFFGAGTRGGRLLVDLGTIADIREVNTFYSEIECSFENLTRTLSDSLSRSVTIPRSKVSSWKRVPRFPSKRC